MLPQIESNLPHIYIKRKLKLICLLHFLVSILSAYGVRYAAPKKWWYEEKKPLKDWCKKAFQFKHKTKAVLATAAFSLHVLWTLFTNSQAREGFQQLIDYCYQNWLTFKSFNAL